MVEWLHKAKWKGRNAYTLYVYHRKMPYSTGHGIEWNYTHCKGFYGVADNPEDCQRINCDYVHFEEYQTLPPHWILHMRKPYSWIAHIYKYPILNIYQPANPKYLPRALGLGYGYEWNYRAHHGFIGVGYHESQETRIQYEQYYNLPPNWDQI